MDATRLKLWVTRVLAVGALGVLVFLAPQSWMPWWGSFGAMFATAATWYAYGWVGQANLMAGQIKEWTAEWAAASDAYQPDDHDPEKVTHR